MSKNSKASKAKTNGAAPVLEVEAKPTRPMTDRRAKTTKALWYEGERGIELLVDTTGGYFIPYRELEDYVTRCAKVKKAKARKAKRVSRRAAVAT